MPLLYGIVCILIELCQANYSFSGALSPLSKLIVCAVMLRGRHRGLPVAIDRAVILPFEFRDAAEDRDDGYMSQRRGSTTELPQTSEPYSEKGSHDIQQRRSWRSGSVDSRRRSSRNHDAEGYTPQSIMQ